MKPQIEPKAIRLANFFLENAEIFYKNKQILRQINITGPKFVDSDIRKYTKILRSEGYPIVSNNQGYAYSEDKELIQECADRIRSQAEEMVITADDLENAMKLL